MRPTNARKVLDTLLQGLELTRQHVELLKDDLFLRITCDCDRCGKARMLSETHTAHRDMLIRDIIARMRHGVGWIFVP